MPVQVNVSAQSFKIRIVISKLKFLILVSIGVGAHPMISSLTTGLGFKALNKNNFSLEGNLSP